VVWCGGGGLGCGGCGHEKHLIRVAHFTRCQSLREHLLNHEVLNDCLDDVCES
jgi:hypothetical protein